MFCLRNVGHSIINFDFYLVQLGHDFDAFFNAESIHCFFSISYTVPEIIKKTKKKHKINRFTKNLVFN